jgi:hypothetical protein
MGKEELLGKIFGDGAGIASSGLGLASAFIDDERDAGIVGAAGGAAGTVSGLTGVLSSYFARKKMQDVLDSEDKASTILSVEQQQEIMKRKKTSNSLEQASGLLGMLGGISDFVGGIGGITGNKKMSRWSGVASGALGLIGGVLGAVKGAKDKKTVDEEIKMLDAKKNGTNDEEIQDKIDELKKEKKAAVNGIIGGGLGGLGAAGGLLGSLLEKDYLSKGGALVGSGLGGISSIAGLFLG